MLTQSTSAINDGEMLQIHEILGDFSKTEFCITVEYTPQNNISNYTTSIIILKKSYAEAEPVAQKIANVLAKHNIHFIKCNTTILWNEKIKRYAHYIY